MLSDPFLAERDELYSNILRVGRIFGNRRGAPRGLGRCIGSNPPTQLDLFLDYASNVALYPKFQEYFRTKRPPLLAVWGKNDPFFLPPGAEAFKRDNPNAEVHFYDAGHFALETHHREIADTIRDFLKRKLTTQASAA